MVRFIFYGLLSLFLISCSVQIENFSKTSLLGENTQDSLNQKLLGKWKRTQFFVEKQGEIKEFNKSTNEYLLNFLGQGILIESSSLSDDTLSWSIAENPPRILLEVDASKMNLNFSNILFIEELNDTLLHVYSKESNNSKNKEDQSIKFHMKFTRIND